MTLFGEEEVLLPAEIDVSVQSIDRIAAAAMALRQAIDHVAKFRIVMTDNIASRRPMTDESGGVLAETVFGSGGADDRWWRRPHLALQSPIARACRYESEPFWVDQAGFRARHPNPDLAAIKLDQLEKRALVAAAIVIPVHLPFGQIGMGALSPQEPGADLGAIFTQHSDQLQLLIRRFITSYSAVVQRRRWLPSDCNLSPREIDCLRWAALGKTDREIALIMERGHSTVRFHLRNAGSKLNSINRSQSILKAGQLGYLGLADRRGAIRPSSAKNSA